MRAAGDEKHFTPPAGRATTGMPESFGSYLLVDRIGAGGMAEVFQAVVFGSEGFRRVLVVKRIRPELSSSPEFVRMFTDEARITALLDHPNIVQVFDFGHVEGTYYLAMEHLDGKDLASVLRVLRPGGVSLRGSLVAQIGLQVARGLHYAHTLTNGNGQPCRIVHRDINPANVMLLRTGGVKVLDFGIAKASSAVGKAQTVHGKLKGKLGYLSPEQARGETLDGQSDVFSLGITMWEMLTGHRLFPGKTDFERIQKVLNAEVRPPSQLRPSIPVALDRIVMQALERDRARRHASAGDMADELEAFLETRRVRSDSIRRLLNELFGAEASVSTERPSVDGSPLPPPVRPTLGRGVYRTGSGFGIVTGAQRTSGAHATLGSGAYASLGSSGAHATVGTRPGEPARPGARALQWVAGAALLIAGVGVILGLIRGGAGARPPPIPSMPLTIAMPEQVPARAPAIVEIGKGTVRIEIQSEPFGASVEGTKGKLGLTPVTVTLPRSARLERLRFEKPGYLPTSYDVRPESDGFVYVELQRDPSPRRADPRATALRSKKTRFKR